MRARFEAMWTETPIAFQNETPPVQPWPPVDDDQSPLPWVYFEVLATSSDVRGAGRQGDKTWLTTGYIYAHVFTSEGAGYQEPIRLADAAGEIFRAATFYRADPGAKVVCGAPMTDGGASDADNGNQFRVTCAIPFEFYFIK